jgi:hypothetical protein
VGQPEKSWNSVDGVIALGTLGAVVVALVVGVLGILRPEFRSLVGLRPKLRAELMMAPPDAHRIVSIAMTADRKKKAEIPTYYFRLRITNGGRVRADNVQVMAMTLRRFDNAAGHWIEEATFFPLYLTWSNIGGTTAPTIAQGMYRHCDLCHVQEWWTTATLGKRQWPPLFKLNTEVDPNPVGKDKFPPNMKRPGRYQLTIAVVADNAKPRQQDIEIRFSGWEADQARMFKQGLVVVARPASR